MGTFVERGYQMEIMLNEALTFEDVLALLLVLSEA